MTAAITSDRITHLLKSLDNPDYYKLASPALQTRVKKFIEATLYRFERTGRCDIQINSIFSDAPAIDLFRHIMFRLGFNVTVTPVNAVATGSNEEIEWSVTTTYRVNPVTKQRVRNTQIGEVISRYVRPIEYIFDIKAIENY